MFRGLPDPHSHVQPVAGLFSVLGELEFAVHSAARGQRGLIMCGLYI